jgi:hypothetical protein
MSMGGEADILCGVVWKARWPAKQKVALFFFLFSRKGRETYDFIDDTFVGVENRGESGITG